MKNVHRIARDFNAQAEWKPETQFDEHLSWRFGSATAKKIIETLKKLELPLPVNQEHYMDGSTGVLIFIDRYATLLRIERKKDARINDSAWILKPFATLDAGNAYIEICGGCRASPDGAASEAAYQYLRHENIDYWDSDSDNAGFLPVILPGFPEGVPVVIDRLAAERINKKNLKADFKRANDNAPAGLQRAVSDYYKPFIKVFRAAWPLGATAPDPELMKGFWAFCARQAEAGKLDAGWKQLGRDVVAKALSLRHIKKPGLAMLAAEKYNSLF